MTCRAKRQGKIITAAPKKCQWQSKGAWRLKNKNQKYICLALASRLLAVEMSYLSAELKRTDCCRPEKVHLVCCLPELLLNGCFLFVFVNIVNISAWISKHTGAKCNSNQFEVKHFKMQANKTCFFLWSVEYQTVSIKLPSWNRRQLINLRHFFLHLSSCL